MPMPTKEAQRKYQREWVARRRAAWFADKSCVKCGTTEDLQLDHIDPTQKVSHSIWSWSQVRREAEITKCQVLCGPHHREKSLEQYEITSGRRRLQHGNYYKYKEGCKCDPCMASVAPYWRAYRARKNNLVDSPATPTQEEDRHD